jgi:hypothetical protein
MYVVKRAKLKVGLLFNIKGCKSLYVREEDTANAHWSSNANDDYSLSL